VKSFVLTPLAQRDLDELWEYVANDNIEAATRVLDGLETSIRRLARNPGIGHVREDLADRRHRFFPVGNYLVVYRYPTHPLQVIRVLHASRDVQSLLNLDDLEE
jgi:toxin ParE1/3/4